MGSLNFFTLEHPQYQRRAYVLEGSRGRATERGEQNKGDESVPFPFQGTGLVLGVEVGNGAPCHMITFIDTCPCPTVFIEHFLYTVPF